MKDKMKDFIAKSFPQESIREHTNKLLQQFDYFLSIYGKHFSQKEQELIKIAIEYHDYGKSNYLFQKDIRKKLKLPPEKLFLKNQINLDTYYKDHPVFHNYLSPAFMPLNIYKVKYDEVDIFAVINAIFYHHNRPIPKEKEITDIITYDFIPRLGESYNFNIDYLSYCMNLGNYVDEKEWNHYALIKGILNRLDYVVSAGDEFLIEISPSQDKFTLGELVEKKLTAKGELREVQKYMKQNSDKNLVVIASTGSGKTEAACLWANGAKLFYTLPFKISINDIYRRIHENKKGYGFKNSTLLHSDALFFLQEEERDETPFVKYRQARFLSYQVTVCTVDQLFASSFRYLGSEIIPAVFRYSKVVIDEIQAYSPEIAARIIYGLKMISNMGGKFAIITATLPPVLENQMREIGLTFEKPQNPFLGEFDSRHVVSYVDGDFDYHLIVEDSKQKKVLIICNTVEKACDVYDKVSIASNCHLLHSRFQKRHRSLLENAIIEFSNNRQDHGIWITTQIVEASLDIDFDVLYTEMCPADSLLQRMGRCYRNRNYDGFTSNIFIYNTGNGIGSIYSDMLIYNNSVNYIRNFYNHLFRENEKIEYVNEVYSSEKLKDSQYLLTLKKELQMLQDLPPSAITKAQAIQKFRNIISIIVIDENTFGELLGNKDFEKLENLKRNKDLIKYNELLNEIMSYTITVDLHCIQNSKNKNMTNFLRRIYTIPSQYDFNENTLSGKGLLGKSFNVTDSIQI